MQQGKVQQKSSGDSLTLTGKGEKDYLDVTNGANRLILSAPGSGGRVQKESEDKKDMKRAIFSMFDLMSKNTQKDRDLCYGKQAFNHQNHRITE